MPDEDREALRGCHVDLLKKIHYVFDILQHLYQLKILEYDELEENQHLPSTKQQVADLLERIKTRGDILDIFVDVLWETRNKEAARILASTSRHVIHQEE